MLLAVGSVAVHVQPFRLGEVLGQVMGHRIGDDAILITGIVAGGRPGGSRPCSRGLPPMLFKYQIRRYRILFLHWQNLLAESQLAQPAVIKLEAVAQDCRYAPGQLVVNKPQSGQLGKSAEFARNVARQLVVLQIQRDEVDQLRELDRYRASEFVIFESQDLQLRQSRPARRGWSRSIDCALSRVPQGCQVEPIRWE